MNEPDRTDGGLRWCRQDADWSNPANWSRYAVAPECGDEVVFHDDDANRVSPNGDQRASECYVVDDAAPDGNVGDEL